ncbi:prephenate dehydrogenase [Auricularia subglabra TFB-10046 SS5]|uniref:Prephenate dehydrogenase n=1 Tax=Auricularia subglabra (strain TFB-10046 / SS5) TaxID=717982 RepID=J0WTY9_AURST|nr:prephenate dehydrogenase [Auricularia subglabra TFB-10046 SS5]
MNATLALYTMRAPSPNDPVEQHPVIGLIGMGEMGRMYAHRLSAAGWRRIHVCDLPQNAEKLSRDMQGVPGVTAHVDGHGVARIADVLLYNVEAEHIARVVAQFGPSTRVGAIVGGQTSVKAPERDAFEKYLPEDTHIVSVHSLHGPTVNPEGQPLVIITHRAPDWATNVVEAILTPLRSRHIRLTYDEHDLVTANTQAVTHAAFLSMGTAWSSQGEYPWEGGAGLFVGGIETVKVNIAIRIYSNKWHVYAGLAILNPIARSQIAQFARSSTELFQLMISGAEDALRERVHRARHAVFGPGSATPDVAAVPLLQEDVLDQFQLGNANSNGRRTSLKMAPENSHLSLLAMVDCWAALNINPFAHLAVAATPIFRLWIGIAQTLFLNEPRLERAIVAAVRDVTYRANDLEFVVAARGWAQCVAHGSFELYERRFAETAQFFEPRFEEATRVGGSMIRAVMEK